MKNDQEIVDQVDRIRKKFKTELESDPLATEMSFIDEMNSIVQKIFKDEKIDVYTALSQENLDEWKKRRRWWHKLRTFSWTKVWMFALLATITGFLVSEAVDFYAADGIISGKTWLKAILTEICFIFISAYRANGWLQNTLATFARVGVFSLMLFVISSGVTTKGLNNINETEVIQQKIEIVEQQVKDKDKLIEFYMEKKWPLTTKKIQDEKQKLVDQLIKLKNEQIGGKNEKASQLEIYKTWARGFFRVLLLAISVLISRKLFKV